MENDYENAKGRLEFILNREWALRGNAPEEFFTKLKNRHPEDTDELINELITVIGYYFLRKNMPEIVGRGSNQIVISLGNGYIGKTRPLGMKTTDHYVVSIDPYEPSLLDSVFVLRELGFDVPEHNYVNIKKTNGSFKVPDQGCSFVIAHDLTEGGKYLVEDVNRRHFSLSNGQEIREQLKKYTRTLMAIFEGNHHSYKAEVNPHLPFERPLKAIYKMFFVQIDTVANTGKLVLGDLDHVILYK